MSSELGWSCFVTSWFPEDKKKGQNVHQRRDKEGQGQKKIGFGLWNGSCLQQCFWRMTGTAHTLLGPFMSRRLWTGIGLTCWWLPFWWYAQCTNKSCHLSQAHQIHTKKSAQMYVRTSKSLKRWKESMEKEQIGMEMEKSIKRRRRTRN